jgi:hypothetical protein
MPDVDLVLATAKLVDELHKTGNLPSDQTMTRLAAQIANGFGAKKDEIAILRLSSDSQMLSFVFPLKLSVVGAIPVSTAHALAAKTIRDKHGEIVNNFSAYRHQTVFEAVDLSAEEKARPIQKIMSSPMVVDGAMAGVIQISRKGRPGEPVGPDFTPADLAELGAVGSILGKYLSEVPAPSSVHPRPRAKA